MVGNKESNRYSSTAIPRKSFGCLGLMHLPLEVYFDDMKTEGRVGQMPRAMGLAP